jgi:hypothetical protein
MCVFEFSVHPPNNTFNTDGRNFAGDSAGPDAQEDGKTSQDQIDPA